MKKFAKIGINRGCYGGGLTVDEQIGLMTENGFEATFWGSEDPELTSIKIQIKRARHLH